MSKNERLSWNMKGVWYEVCAAEGCDIGSLTSKELKIKIEFKNSPKQLL